jgi:hypothetical protein
MSKKTLSKVASTALAITILTAPGISSGQQASAREESSPFVLGSILLSIIYIPVKLVTCVGTQVTGAAAYVGTYGVLGHYDGGTNGRDIGETARRSCTGDWIIPASQVRKDYGSQE